MAQSAKCLTLDFVSGHNLRVVRLISVWDSTPSGRFSLSHPLALPPPYPQPHLHILSLSQRTTRRTTAHNNNNSQPYQMLTRVWSN